MNAAGGADNGERIARAAKALIDGTEVLARRLAVEERKLIPGYAVIEENAHAKRIETVLRELPNALKTGRLEKVLVRLRQNMQLVMTSGVEAADFIQLSYLYLSVMRKLVVASSPDPREGLRDWDALEHVIMGPPARAFVNLALEVEEPTMPGTRTIPFPPDDSDGLTDED